MVTRHKVAYIFPGQGAQYVGMGKGLYDKFPLTRQVYDAANDIAGFDLKSLCFEGPAERLSTTAFSQPAILVTSIAALQCVQAYVPGLDVKAALGLSLGEYTALVAAESLSFEDGVRLVRSRGQFMEEASRDNPGKMASVIGIERAVAEDICKKAGCEIANLNCPGQIVISGTADSVEKAIFMASEKGARKSIILDVSGAFHSSLMAGAKDKLAAVLDGVVVRRPIFPFIGNVNASYESTPLKIKDNLLKQLTGRTYWEDSIRLLMKDGVETFIEIGPGKVLKGLLRRIDSNLTVHSAGTAEDMRILAESGVAGVLN